MREAYFLQYLIAFLLTKSTLDWLYQTILHSLPVGDRHVDNPDMDSLYQTILHSLPAGDRKVDSPDGLALSNHYAVSLQLTNRLTALILHWLYQTIMQSPYS